MDCKNCRGPVCTGYRKAHPTWKINGKEYCTKWFPAARDRAWRRESKLGKSYEDECVERSIKKVKYEQALKKNSDRNVQKGGNKV